MKFINIILLLFIISCAPVTSLDHYKKANRIRFRNETKAHMHYMKSIVLDSSNANLYYGAAWNIYPDSFELAKHLTFEGIKVDSTPEYGYYQLSSFFKSKFFSDKTPPYAKRQIIDSTLYYIDKYIQYDSTNIWSYLLKSELHRSHTFNWDLYELPFNEKLYHDNEAYLAFEKAVNIGYEPFGLIENYRLYDTAHFKFEAETAYVYSTEAKFNNLRMTIFNNDHYLEKDSLNDKLYFEKGLNHLEILKPEFDSCLTIEKRNYHFTQAKTAFQKACELGYKHACGY